MLVRLLITLLTILVIGCSTKKPKPQPPNPLAEAKPISILVLPPKNNSLEVDGASAILAHAVRPLTEWGYYVIPIPNMLESFRANGMFAAEDIHDIPLNKLSEVFGADAVLYMTVTMYGVNYKILNSNVEVAVNATMIDSRTGQVLWKNSVRQIQQNNNSDNLIGALIGAVVEQISNSLSDAAYDLSRPAMTNLISGGRMVKGKYLTEFLENQQKQQKQ